MSHPQKPSPNLFFLAITGKDLSLWEKVLINLEPDLGKVVLQSEIYDFSSFTSYYAKEMGEALKKGFYFFERLREPEFLIDLKYTCYKIERELAEPSGNRTVNLDPGYIALSKIVLSTFKDFSHRIYIGKGVFAEVTLIFKGKSFTELPWTYPDYKQPQIIATFNKARAWYKNKLKGLQCL